MATGLAVVSTRLGSEGIAAENGKHVELADTPEAFARATISLLRDRSRAAELGRAARDLAMLRYDWAVLAPALDAVHERAADLTRS